LSSRGEIAVKPSFAGGEALALPALAALTRARELGHGQRRQRFLQRDVDIRTRFVGQDRMHTGTRGGQAADESRLLADRPQRRFRQIVDLPGEQSSDAARIEQSEICRRIVGLRSGFAVRRNRDHDSIRIRATERRHRVRAGGEQLRRTLTHDQASAGECGALGLTSGRS
jgi:hypothetical protein